MRPFTWLQRTAQHAAVALVTTSTEGCSPRASSASKSGGTTSSGAST